MQFDAFISRADDQLLQELLGKKVLRFLRAIDGDKLTPRRQRDLLLQQTKPQALLGSRKTRTLLFDLLRPDEAAQLARGLGLNDADPYAALSKAGTSGVQMAAILDFFELSSIVVERPEPSPDNYDINPAYALFPHQNRAVGSCLTALSVNGQRVLLHMPTGAGKTRTAMHIVSRYLNANSDRAVVWLAHSEELCEQAADEFDKAWTSLGSHALKIHRFWSNHNPSLFEIAGDFIVAGLPKTYAAVRRSLGMIGRLGAQTGLVVMDEAHQAIAPTYQLILDALVDAFPNVALLGLSATPGRSWNNPVADVQLSDYFGRQKVVLEVEGYTNPVEYLIDNGYLARATFSPLFFSNDTSLSDKDRRRIETDLEIPPEVLSRLAHDEMRNLAILAEIENLAKRHKRIIVFATTVEHSELLAFALRARGHWACSVTSVTSAPDRQASIEAYKSDATGSRIICNFGVLTTGFDAPRTSAALIARPTTSLVLYSQMVGRATRGPRAGGNSDAEIVTIVDSKLPGFGDVAEAFINWEDVWGSK